MTSKITKRRGNLKNEKLTITTAADGSATVLGTIPFDGLLYAVEYLDTDMADTTDLTLSCVAVDGMDDWNLFVIANVTASKVYYPRTLEHLDTDGSELTSHNYPLVNGTVKLVVAQGGDTKTGAVVVHVLEQDIG